MGEAALGPESVFRFRYWMTLGNEAELANRLEALWMKYSGEKLEQQEHPRSAQTCALGAAIAGAIVAGAHPDYPAAQKAMTGLKPRVFKPNPQAHATYRELYALYKKLHDAFGLESWSGSLSDVMKSLIDIRSRVRK
jgi:L-ribulokinase